MCRLYEELRQREFTRSPKVAALLSEKSLPSPSRLDVTDAMLKVARKQGIKDKRVEETILKRGGWIWQQFAKLWARQLIGFDGDYVVIDSDIVWFRDVRLVDHGDDLSSTSKGGTHVDLQCRYFYATVNSISKCIAERNPSARARLHKALT